MDPDEYCREIEAYLCRKNDGHLIRIVGPSFERVCSWSTRGVPFKIACQGIDRYFVRYYAKGPKRRPVQIDFCEADVLDAFDAWRRSVGVRLPGAGTEAPTAQRRRSLPEHLVSVCEKITARLASGATLPEDLKRVLDEVVNEASSFTGLPAPIRGEVRARISARLTELDRTMLDALREQADATALRAFTQEAAEQLAPFRDRMPEDTYHRSLDAAIDRLLRERENLPTVSFE